MIEPVWNFTAWCSLVLLYAIASRYNRPPTADVQARETFSKPFIIWLGPVQILMACGQLLLALGLYLLWNRDGWAVHYLTFALALMGLVFAFAAQHIFWTRSVCGVPALLIYVSLILVCIAAAKASSALTISGVFFFVFAITNPIPLAVYFTIMWHRKSNFETTTEPGINMVNNANAFVFAQDPEPHIVRGPPAQY